MGRLRRSGSPGADRAGPVLSAVGLSVTLVGDPVEGGLTNSLERGFRDEGWEPHVVPWAPTRPKALHSAAYRWPALAMPFRRWLRLTLSQRGDADLVVMVKGQFIDRRTVEWVQRRFGAPVVCWNPDSPFDLAISNCGAGIPQAIPAYDCYVTWAEDIAERLAPITSLPVVIPFGWDPHVHFPERGSAGAADRAVFIGSWTEDRERWLRRIAAFEPLVFGNRWRPVPGVEIRPQVGGREFRVVMGEARWCLNFLRPQNRFSHNMRTFEIPGCGGRQLAESSPDHRRLLPPTGAALFDGPEQLAELLGGGPTPRVSQAHWLGPHAYACRVRSLLATLGLAETRP